MLAIEKIKKFIVFESNELIPYFKKHHKKIPMIIEQQQLFLEIICYALATQITGLHGVFGHYLRFDENLKKPYKFGKWLGQFDWIRYLENSIVNTHCDAGDIIKKGITLNHPFKGPFGLEKCPSNLFKGEPQKLCHESKKSTGCNHKTSLKPTDPLYGEHGHLDTKCIYFMFSYGAQGGAQHAVHNAEDFKRFRAISYTNAYRPKTI